ncbi:TPR and ankyrin repeat-containing protein 1 [Branchiostoma belcheri]|nr:TPR and ankyrin repeat-containing protein 1 [Branchiostoma belcheri]
MFIGGFWRKITMEFHFYDDDAGSADISEVAEENASQRARNIEICMKRFCNNKLRNAASWQRANSTVLAHTLQGGVMETTHGTAHIERQMSVEQDDLREFKLDNTGCRVCGVTFESRPHIRDDVEEQEEGHERDTFEEEWDADPDGTKTEEDDMWLGSGNGMTSSYLKLTMKGNDGAVMSEVQKVNTAHNSLRKLLEKIKDECAWNKRQDAYEALHALQDALVAFRRVKRLIERQADEEGASAAFVDEEAEEFRNLDEDDFIAVGGEETACKGQGWSSKEEENQKESEVNAPMTSTTVRLLLTNEELQCQLGFED